VESRSQSSESRELRVIIIAPRGKDGRLLCHLLNRVAIDAEICADIPSAVSQLLEAGALIVADEALTPDNVKELAGEIHAQPAWSDFPLIVLTTSGQVSEASIRRSALRKPLGNVLLLERPVRPETLISTVQSALRSRRRQYEMRDQLRQLHDAHEALLRSEKLSVAGRLAASIAHEINNPLEAVVNLVYLARTSNSATAEREDYLLAAEKELARVSEITNQTLKFYRQPTAPRLTDVAGVLNSVLLLYQGRLHNSSIVVAKDFEPVPSVMAFEGELRQLFANLIGNSLDAMRHGGKLNLRLRSKQSTNGRIPGIQIVVADTGSGVSPAIKARVFEPFVSTKGDRGTGLGLWVSSKIVSKHGGTMRLRSRVVPPSGTVVSVFFPAKSIDLPQSAAD